MLIKLHIPKLDEFTTHESIFSSPHSAVHIRIDFYQPSINETTSETQ